MGGETAKFIRLGEGGQILDYETNGDCAASTGSFIDQQAARLRYRVEEAGDIALGAPSAAWIAGRCSVFAKSDMVHAQQKGYGPPEILRGLAEAVARNFKGSITKGKPVVCPVTFIGGLAANRAVVEALRECFRLGGGLFVPEAYAWFGAVGAALLAARGSDVKLHRSQLRSSTSPPAWRFPTHPALSLERVVLLRDRVRPYRFPYVSTPLDVFLGIDVGSVSTNFTLLDETGELVGADAVKDEITAHKTGAAHVSALFDLPAADTIGEDVLGRQVLLEVQATSADRSKGRDPRPHRAPGPALLGSR